MRILVISDSHGKNDDVKQVIEQVGEIDMFIHLGDIERGPDYIRGLAGCECHMISGNNDYDINLPDTDSFMIGDKKVFITHGHRFYVGSGVERLRQYALDNGISEITLVHDYQGISCWCTGEWKANKAGTIKYQQFYLEAKKLINISATCAGSSFQTFAG